MAGQTSTGFLEELGLGNFNEQQAFQKFADAGRLNTRTEAGDFMQLGQSLGQGIAPLIAGTAAGVGGLISGDDGRSFGQFKEDFSQGITDQRDNIVAAQMGLTGGAEELRSKRNMIQEITQAKASFVDDGSFTNRIDLAKKVAEIANRNGDVDVAARAMKQVSELEKEQQEFAAAGIENEAARRTENTIADVGLSGFDVKDGAEGAEAKFIKIPEGEPNAGMYRKIQAGKEDEVVEGARIITGAERARQKAASRSDRPRVADSLFNLVKNNVGGGGKIPETRAQMSNITEVAGIVSNSLSALSSIADPQAALNGAGAIQIGADKVVRTVESIVSLWTSDDKHQDGGNITYKVDGKDRRMSAKGQYDMVVNKRRDTILNQFMNDNGMLDLQEMLPAGMEKNTQAAQLYLANIMELAYLDARIQEPSNRGLSDNDIKAALQRIGADTADPMVFAKRQLEVINTKLLPKIENLGQNFTTFDNPTYTKEDVINEVYDPKVRQDTLDQLLQTKEELETFINRGSRGQGGNDTGIVGSGTAEDPIIID